MARHTLYLVASPTAPEDGLQIGVTRGDPAMLAAALADEVGMPKDLAVTSAVQVPGGTYAHRLLEEGLAALGASPKGRGLGLSAAQARGLVESVAAQVRTEGGLLLRDAADVELAKVAATPGGDVRDQLMFLMRTYTEAADYLGDDPGSVFRVALTGLQLAENLFGESEHLGCSLARQVIAYLDDVATATGTTPRVEEIAEIRYVLPFHAHLHKARCAALLGDAATAAAALARLDAEYGDPPSSPNPELRDLAPQLAAARRETETFLVDRLGKARTGPAETGS